MVSCSFCAKCFLSSKEEVSKSDNDVVVESHYGCYRYGVLVAIAIIFLLIIGCVPVFLATKNNSIIFTVIFFTILVIGVFIYFYFEWQIRKARMMHERIRRGEIPIERVYVAVKSNTDDLDDKKLQPGKVKSDKSYKNVNADVMTQIDLEETDDRSTASYKAPWLKNKWIKDENVKTLPKYTIV